MVLLETWLNKELDNAQQNQLSMLVCPFFLQIFLKNFPNKEEKLVKKKLSPGIWQQ